jgi:nucleoside-diphosphate-sugar epimerase
MEIAVTGAAGFIGSHLCERLLAEGHRVTGIDNFTDYYDRQIKESNLTNLHSRKHFRFHEKDLATADLTTPMLGCEVIYHLAATPGLVRSWTHFDEYNRNNIQATHRLLEHAKQLPHLHRFVFASTSSVYGRFASGDESLPTRPSSPYGITKLACENLCRVYMEEFGIPTVVLRYFSVYGPRQRPDMGYHKFIQCVLREESIPLTGDGSQVRGNTFVHDCVDASVAAMNTVAGETYNIGGGETIAMAEVIARIEKITGVRARIDYRPERPGDQKHTAADIGKFQRHTGWKPKIGMDEGLARQVEWQAGLNRRVSRAA